MVQIVQMIEFKFKFIKSEDKECNLFREQKTNISKQII